MQDGVKLVRCHAGPGQCPLFLDIRIDAAQNDKVTYRLTAGLEQQRDIETNERSACLVVAGKKAVARRRDKRVDDGFQQLSLVRAGKHLTAKPLAVD